MREVLNLVHELRTSTDSQCALALCIEQKLVVKENAMDPSIRAVLIRLRNTKMIIVNRSLKRIPKCLAIYHELFHHYSRIPHRSPFHRNEIQAEMFAACMVLTNHPEPVARCRLNNERLECNYLAMIIKMLQK